MDLVCWCLQTGTAERFSKQLGNELRRKYGDGVVVEVVDIENYKAETRLPKEKLVLYLMATYGEPAVPAACRQCAAADMVHNQAPCSASYHARRAMAWAYVWASSAWPSSAPAGISAWGPFQAVA